MDVMSVGRRVGLSAEVIAALTQAPLSPISTEASISLRSSLFTDDDASDAGSISTTAAGPHEQLETLIHEKQMMEIEHGRQIQRAKLQFQQLTKRHREDTHRLRSDLSELQKRESQMKGVLESRREEFYDISCTPNVYQQLLKSGESTWSTKELVQVKIFELTATLRAQVASAQREMLEFKKERDELRHSADEAKRMLSRLDVSSKREKTEMENEIERLRTEVEGLKHKFISNLNNQDDMRERAGMYNAVRSRCDELERDKGQVVQQLEASLERVAESERNLNRALDESKLAVQQNEVLKVDKSYLNRQIDELKRDVQRMKQTLDRQEEKMNIVELREDKLRERLLESEQKAKSIYEERLEKEVSTLKGNNFKQIRDLREAHVTLQEREIKSLRIAKEDALTEVEHLRHKMQDIQNVLEDTKLELATKQATFDAQVMEIRSQVKMRIFENENLAGVVEEKTSLFRKSELQVEMLQNQLEILKHDFLALDSSSSKQLVELHTKMITQEEKIAVYESLETELDAAVIQQAQIGSIQFTNNERTLIPVAAQRRVQHSVMLAQKLLKAERIVESQQVQLREKEAEMMLLRKNMSLAEIRASSAEQPQAFLLQKMKSKDDELALALRKVEMLEEERLGLVDKLNEALESRQALHEDLTKVIASRTQLHTDCQEAHIEFKESYPDQVVQEVDQPNIHETSVFSDASSFFLHQETGNESIPLPKWHRKISPPEK